MKSELPIKTPFIMSSEKDTLSHVTHEIVDGYLSEAANKYYCSPCATRINYKTNQLKYHTVSQGFPNITEAKCCICGNNVSIITPLVDCRQCFLRYLDGEREQELKN